MRPEPPWYSQKALVAALRTHRGRLDWLPQTARPICVQVLQSLYMGYSII